MEEILAVPTIIHSTRTRKIRYSIQVISMLHHMWQVKRWTAGMSSRYMGGRRE